jgi:cyanophycin synthetase
MPTAPAAGSLVEVRLLDGPNLYFPRPAAKVTLDLTELLRLSIAGARDLGVGLGLSTARPGAAGSIFRQRFAIRLVTQIVRRLARIGGVTRLAVRTRTGRAVRELVVAYPWRNSGRAEALAYGLARVLDSVAAGPEAVAEMINTEGAAVAAAQLGAAPRLIRPRIPVVAITGTNGKTTTARMIGHVARRAGRSVGWSSTDGVYIDGELIESGDFSGPGGAGRVLRHPGVELAVTETARGGILRRGVGVAYNDVSVVTNISADHLGADGIDTLDQLAEVKAVITKITKPDGWCVLNADDAARALSHGLTGSGCHDVGDLPRCPAAEIAVLAHDQHVEMPCRLAAEFAHVFVPAIAGSGDDAYPGYPSKIVRGLQSVPGLVHEIA